MSDRYAAAYGRLEAAVTVYLTTARGLTSSIDNEYVRKAVEDRLDLVLAVARETDAELAAKSADVMKRFADIIPLPVEAQ